MSIIENGSYPVTTSYKTSEDDFVFILSTGQKVQVNAPHLRSLKLIDCTKITIDNDRKKTPVLIHTAYSYISACNYTVLS